MTEFYERDDGTVIVKDKCGRCKGNGQEVQDYDKCRACGGAGWIIKTVEGGSGKITRK